MQNSQEEIYHLGTRKALAEHLFMKREVGFQYAPFEREIAFYDSVCTGSLETMKALFTPLGGEGFGKLCEDPLQNLKYHLVVSIAMITRFCISGGMQPEEAYSLSDIWIQKTDVCKNIDELRTVHFDMAVSFTKRMRQILTGQVHSHTTVRVLDYISDHLHERIYLDDLAAAVQKSVPYLSRLFAKEIGTTITDYISRKKIEAAANMLQFSDYTAAEISSFFCFSSQSYFIKQFKRYIGITPKEYREKFYSVGWMTEKPYGNG